MAAQHDTMKTCNQTYSTSPWTETYHAMMSRPAQNTASQSMPEQPSQDETQAPTHDALSAIYNREN
jgi:hypothetical protein